MGRLTYRNTTTTYRVYSFINPLKSCQLEVIFLPYQVFHFRMHFKDTPE